MRGSRGQTNTDVLGGRSLNLTTGCYWPARAPPLHLPSPIQQDYKSLPPTSQEQIDCVVAALWGRSECEGGDRTSRHKVEGSKRRERPYPLRRVRPLYPAKTELLRMGHTMRNLAEMGLLKNRSAFICRPTPEEALKWGDSLDKLLTHKCKLLLPPLLSLCSLCLWCLWCIMWNRGRDWYICWNTYRCRNCRLLQQVVF